jgi:two-component system chemotaxis response regulator CheB
MVRVLIVDDSALVRQLLGAILGSAPGIEVVGTAADPYVAREKIKQLSPDVLTLDVEMPRMDGLTFLGNLMRLRPMPVVMVSSLTQQGAEVTLQALELGAVDFVAKPKLDVAKGLAAYAEEIVDKVRAAAASHPRPPTVAPARAAALPDVPARLSADAVIARSSPRPHFRTTEHVIGIGASTGGTEAIKDVLRELPADMPGIVVTQHIPEAFSAPFARRLDGVCALTVVEARDGQLILPGHAYVAPGNRHLLVIRDGARLLCRLNDGPPVNRHKPSVDVMFRSLAQNAGPNAVAVMLTGMGADGAEGTGEMKAAGAPVVAQDERTSVVWGMPGEVVRRGLADDVLPLPRIAARLVELARNSP